MRRHLVVAVVVAAVVLLSCAEAKQRVPGSKASTGTHFHKARSPLAPQNKTDLFTLIPGRYPQALSLPDVLADLPTTPEGRQTIALIIAYLKEELGVEVPTEIMDQILENAYMLLDFFLFTPEQLRELWLGLNLAQGLAPVPLHNATDGAPKIPSGFKYPTDVDSIQVNMSAYIPTISQFGNLWLGFFFPNTTTVAQAKKNVVMAAVFDALSLNCGVHERNYYNRSHPEDPFVVSYNGKNFTSIEGFLAEIVRTGGSVSTYVTKRIAAFFGFYAKSPSGQWREIANPLMIATGFYNSDRTEEAVLPAIHSEFVVHVALPDGGENFTIVWYEGDDGIGFFAGNMYVLESWVGESDGPVLTGMEAVNAIQAMSVLTDVLLTVAWENNLYDWGYGISGVCDDSCAFIEILTTNVSLEYPFLMQKSIVIPKLAQRIHSDATNSRYYYAMLEIANGLPIDWRSEKDPSAPSRALGTIVWPEGREPFQCVVDARAILSSYVQGNLVQN